MKKYCDWWLLPLLACLLAGCGDDDYHYPSVKLEFLTAFSGADGYLRSVVTDERNLAGSGGQDKDEHRGKRFGTCHQ